MPIVGSRRPVALSLGAGVRRNVLVGVLLFVGAFAVRAWGLDQPDQPVFDESHYAFDAYSYLGGTPDLGIPSDPVKIPNEGRWEHPPLAKILIASGEGALGFEPIGWRLPAAVVGSGGVVVVFLLGLCLFERTATAAAAAFFTLLDGLHIVQSRVAMLDIFATTFATIAVLCLLLERRTGASRWRWWGGAALGAAVACKWSMGTFVPLFGLLLVTTARRDRASWRTVAARLTIAGVLAPAVVYVASYTPFWIAHGPDIPAFVELQQRMVLRLHYGEDETPAVPEGYLDVPFASPAWTWPLLLEPIRYVEVANPGVRPERELWAIGNPALWWGHLALFPAILWAAVRRDFPLRVAASGYLLAWAPWLVVGRPTYSYYLVAGVPFMSLAVAGVLSGVRERWRKPVWGAFGAAFVGCSVLFLPLWTAQRLPPWDDALRWLPSW